MIIAYVVISLMLGGLWTWANEGNTFDEVKPIFLTPTTIKEMLSDMNTTQIGSVLFIALFAICNFFTLPWSFLGLVGRALHKVIFKQKEDK